MPWDAGALHLWHKVKSLAEGSHCGQGLEHVGIESWVCSIVGRLREAILLSSAPFWEKIEKVESASCRYLAVC